eukprot:PhM_4_TR6933/c0_g1_i1/m.23856
MLPAGGAGAHNTRQLDGADSEAKWRKKYKSRESARDKYAHEYERERERLRKLFEAEERDQKVPTHSRLSGTRKMRSGCNILGDALWGIGTVMGRTAKATSTAVAGFVFSKVAVPDASRRQQQQQYDGGDDVADDDRGAAFASTPPPMPSPPPPAEGLQDVD